MRTVLIAVGLSLAGVICLLLFLKLVFGAIRRRLVSEVAARFSERDILKQSIGANFFGRESKGMGQVRGNGALVLTGQDLWFLLVVPRREISIPLRDVTAVGTKKSHLGKSVLRPLLHVQFRSDGRDDSIAWWVVDPDAWCTAIDHARSSL